MSPLVQQEQVVDLLASDASEELLELELRATTPLDTSKLAGQHQLQDQQLQVMHDQVEQLQAQLQAQAAQQKALEVCDGVLHGSHVMRRNMAPCVPRRPS